MKRKLIWILLCWAVALPAFGFTQFTIHNIQVQGLQRLEKGTVLTYLPVSVGDSMNQAEAQRSIRSLYHSGLFRKVSLAQDGNTLIVRVKERPAIASFKITGNDHIGGDKLKKGLKQAGLAEGELLSKALLESVGKQLREQYYANGYYNVQIDTQVKNLPNNRVSLRIKVREGKVATIKQINIVGNEVYSDETLVKTFQLGTANVLSFYTKNNRYSRQKLIGDLEGLTSYYQDRGYLKFNIDSVQVSLSPNKRAIYVTINVSEGRVYKVGGYRLTGKTILQPQELKKYISVKSGQTFSRQKVNKSGERISNALADVGYAFAKVEPRPRINEDSGTVEVNFHVEPGPRVYVRRITFSGNQKTNDSTLRREMRQLEGAWYTRSAVHRGKIRLQRLPFIKTVKVNTQRVPGSRDEVDVNYQVKERPAGSIQLGLGYSQSNGILVTGQIDHKNFLGTGETLSLRAANDVFSRSVRASWTNPYITPNGISRTITAGYRHSNSVIRYSSGFDIDAINASLYYGIPLSEFVSYRLGAGYSTTAINTYANETSNEVLGFVARNGTTFNEYSFLTGIRRDTRNRTLFASRGALYSLDLSLNVPGSSITFYSATAKLRQYIPMPLDFILKLDANVGYENAYGSDSEIPPYENQFAGGPNSVRGYRAGSLGPRDTPYNNPLGGKFLTTEQTELILPVPLLTNNTTTRLSAFFDAGNVFAEPGDFSVSRLRTSTGLSFTFFTPFLGMLEVSYAFPLNDKPGDEVKHFQISFGTGF